MKRAIWAEIADAAARSGSWGPIAVISTIFMFMAAVHLLTGITPNHDSMEWEGASHYFYTCVGNGVFPYWNPYSQTGTPFFINYQGFGLLEPSNFLFIGLMKLTGCPSLTAYVLHFLFYYFIFIAGSYFLLLVTTRERLTSLIFSLVLLLATFAPSMRQNGMLQYYFLVPFVTYFIIRFFDATDLSRKGLYFFLVALLSAASLNIHIPSGFIFYLLVFCAGALMFRVSRISELLRFALNWRGMCWILISALAFCLICTPVVALYHEFHDKGEIIPTVRILQKTNGNLSRFFASDLSGGLLDEGFSNNQKTSLARNNAIGFFTEPLPLGHFYSMNFTKTSEVRLYGGILTLLCTVIALLRSRNRFRWIYGILFILLLLAACNFGKLVLDRSSSLQSLLMTAFPMLKKMEVLQNLGGLLILCFVMLGAIGFKQIREEGNRSILLLSISLIFVKTALLTHKWLQGHELLFGKEEHLDFILWMLLASFLVCLYMLYRVIRNLRYETLFTVAVSFLLLELVFFNFFYINVQKAVLYPRYYGTLRGENVLDARIEGEFFNYRIPFSAPGTFFNSFFGHEIYHERKVAWPISTRNAIYLQRQEYDDLPAGEIPVVVVYDHFYMTVYYYDYMANVRLDKQLAISGVLCPILNFFPLDDVIFVGSKYEMVRKINETPIEELARHIYIDRGKENSGKVLRNVSDFFSPSNYIQYSRAEISDFMSALRRRRFPPYPGASIDVKDFGVNHLTLSVKTEKDGYLYYGDGFSKHWKAFVNDRPVSIEKTSMNFKSVPIGKGSSNVRFEFDPHLYRKSLGLYFIGILLGIIGSIAGALIARRSGRGGRQEFPKGAGNWDLQRE
jgi:hypothetical protein